MDKIKKFIGKCIDEKGYGKSDILMTDVQNINEKQNEVEQILKILITDKVTYPIDMEFLTEHLRMSKSEYLVYTDGERLHIFSMKNDHLNEISNIPHIEQAGKSDEIADSKLLRNIFWNLRSKSLDSDFINDVLAMSIQTYREKRWDGIKQSIDSDLLLKIYNHVVEKYPLAVGDSMFENDVDHIINNMLAFEKVKFDGDALCSADLYRKIFCDSTYRIGPRHLIDMMTKFVVGKTAVSSAMQATFIINTTRTGDTLDYYGISPSRETNMIRLMCKDQNKFFNRWFISDKNYDSVIILPPFSMMNYDEVQPEDSMFANQTVELGYRMVENALNHLNDGGRLVVAVTGGFLYSLRNRKLRDHIKSNYHISSIVELDRPLDGTAINIFLIVIENKPSGDCLMSAEPVERKDFGRLGNLLLTYEENATAIPNTFYTVTQTELVESWMPKEYEPDNMKLKEELADWTPLKNYCELINSRPVPSKNYLDEGTLGGMPYLRISNIKDSEINLDGCVRVPAKYVDNVPKKGDIVFSIIGSIGKIALVDDEEFLLSPQIILLRCKKGYSPEKIFHALKDPVVGKQIAIKVIGSTISSFSKKDVLNLRIRLE